MINYTEAHRSQIKLEPLERIGTEYFPAIPVSSSTTFHSDSHQYSSQGRIHKINAAPPLTLVLSVQCVIKTFFEILDSNNELPF